MDKINLILFFLASLFSCQNSDTEIMRSEKKHLENSVSTEVSVTVEQFEKMKILLGEIPRLPHHQARKATGTLHLPPQNRALVSSMLAGKITSIYVHEGENVAKGQILAKISDLKVITLQKDFFYAKAEIRLKKAELERQQQLKIGDATSEKNLVLAETAYQSAVAQFESLSAELRLIGLNPDILISDNISSEIAVTAPVSGSLYGISCNLGEYVLPEKPIFEIYNKEHLHLEILVYENDIADVKIGQKVSFKPTNNKAKAYEAIVYAVAKGIDVATKTVRVHAETSGETDGLMPGMFTEVYIQNDDREADILSEKALIFDDEKVYAFRLKEESAQNYLFEMLSVKAIKSDSGFVISNFGDKRNDFVLDGAFYLKAILDKNKK